ncbi:MAG TPA: hypothetical protein VFD49_21065 [Candidatus Dormibacteraeota bacterium]|nr:hypothetical protein [Candidatus Dormibacteraeota bacterium]
MNVRAKFRTPAPYTPRGGRPGRQRPVPKSATEDLSAELFDSVRGLCQSEYPEFWAALTPAGQELFVRDVLAAMARPKEDRVQALRAVLQCWLDEWNLVANAPDDDEPFTEDEEREAEAAEQEFELGEAVPFEQVAVQRRQ